MKTFVCGICVVMLALVIVACNDLTTSPEIPVHSHQWSAWGNSTATCVMGGVETRVCALDATHTETRTVDVDTVNGHDWETWEQAEAEGKVTVEPTCEKVGNGHRDCLRNDCDAIDEKKGNIPALGHDYQNWMQTTGPTCTAAGVDTGTCSRDTTHTTTRTGAVALGHDYQNWTQTTAPTCTAAGVDTGTCSRDTTHTTTRAGSAINPNAHDYQWVTIAPTFIEEGAEKERCTRCRGDSGNTRDPAPALIITTVADWTTARTQLNGRTGSYTLTISGNIAVPGSIANSFGTTASGSLTVTLKGSGRLYLTSQGSLITVAAKQTLIIDSEDLVLEGRSNNNASLLSVLSDANLELKSGTIKSNTTSGNGGGVSVNGTFTMSGGVISGNTTSGNGGGVSVYGTLTMEGGEISGNTAGNNSSTGGGGVYVVASGTFFMNGGKISGNTANRTNASPGGGAYVYGTLTMSGGVISGNTSASGGGVDMRGIFVMSGGEISGNTSVNSTTSGGHGVFLFNSFGSTTFTMTGGEISSNGGYGVDANTNATFTMSGGKISGNTRGGVYVGGIFTMNDGVISGNTSASGGGVSVNGTFTMNGGVISGNTSTSGGGGVSVSSISSAIFRIVTGTVYGSSEGALSNTITGSSASGAALHNSGTAQYGTFNSTTWVSAGSLSTTNDTIRVVNGELQ